jgi:methylglutaconyl-CoA hydratase
VSDVRAERDGPVVTLTLDRPDRRNALDPHLLASLAEAFRGLSTDDSVRVIVLTGAGSAFSAGADLGWMRASRTLSRDDNRAEAAAMAEAFDEVDRCPKAVIARVNGPAIGGGAGLVACADVAVAVEGTRFAFAEVRLGLLPATIAPYVVRAIGPGNAR